MRLAARRLDCLTEAEIRAIVDHALAILETVGLRIENRRMCEVLAERGGRWDGEERVRFPQSLMEQYLTAQRAAQVRPAEFSYSGHVGGYPLRWVDPADGQVKPQTARSVADLTRLADGLEHITSIGSVGVPNDVPPLLRPFVMRFLNWRHAERKVSNTYVIWDTRLCPYILEFCEAVSALEPQLGGMARFFRATNYLVSPLRYAREEAAQFVWFWERGHRVSIGNLATMGGTAPATVAGAIGLALAEMMAISFIGHVFHGDEGLHLATGVAPLDMRSGYMPFGRPEQTLSELALSQVAEYLGARDAGSAGRQTGAKGPDVECGLSKGLHPGLELALLGKLSFSFGKFSTDEVMDPRLMVIENDFVGSLRRLARGFEVTPETLALPVVQEVGVGGTFLDHPHTVAHFRQEIWMPSLFSGANYEQWASTDGRSILDKARDQVLALLDAHHPRGLRPETEDALLALIDQYARQLGEKGIRPLCLSE